MRSRKLFLLSVFVSVAALSVDMETEVGTRPPAESAEGGGGRVKEEEEEDAKIFFSS